MSEVTYQGSKPLYYRLSGKFSLLGVALTILIGCAVAIPLAFAYAYCVLYIPIGGYVTFLLTGGFALCLGWGVGAMLKKTRTRNKMIGLLIIVLVTTFAYLLSWEAYIYGVRQQANIAMPFFTLLKDPELVLKDIKSINAVGIWKMKEHRPHGIELTILWTLEAGLIYLISCYITLSMLGKVPYCEACQKWGIVKLLTNTNVASDIEVKAALERHDFSIIESLGRPLSATEFYTISLQGCPDCDTTQTLCIDRTTITVNKKGEQSTKNNKVIFRLTLTPEEVVDVAQYTALAQMKGMPPAADAGMTSTPENPLA